MDFFGFQISSHLHGRWCRFIIHRYLGHLLEKNLSLEQLSIDLTGGCVQIEQVMLNVQYINELLSTVNLPIRLVDGFIGSIKLQVPWSSLMADPSKAELSDVQLTLRTIEPFDLNNKELMSSMLDSVVDSIVSSIDLAQSFCKEEKDEGRWREGGEESVHALSKIVDAIVSRFCCSIDDLIVRIESDASPSSDLSTALELKITRLRFMDEQMRLCREEGNSAKTITTQPTGMTNVTNLNKYMLLEGVSLYTDIFSKSDLPAASDIGSPVTSMYLRREHKKSLQIAGSPHASMYMSTNLADSMMSGTYQSCYSATPSPSLDELKPVKVEPTLISNPVKIAEVAGEVTVVIRMLNSEQESRDEQKTKVLSAADEPKSKYELVIDADNINVLVTPSQVELIQALTDLLVPVDDKFGRRCAGGKPMGSRDFDIVNRQLDDITAEYDCQTGGNALGRAGNWQGVEDFHAFKSVSLKDDNQHRLNSIRIDKDKAVVDTSKHETVLVSLKVGVVVAVLTHDDPLSTEEASKWGKGPREAVESLHINAKRFFDRAHELTMPQVNSMAAIQQVADGLYLKDHIRFVGKSVVVTHSIDTSPGTPARISTKVTVESCDVSEYLTAEHTMEGEARQNKLLSFERDVGDEGTQLTVMWKNEDPKSSSIIVHMSQCNSDVDMSIMDRISHLICPRPIFRQSPMTYMNAQAPSALSEDLFSEVFAKEAVPCSIEINCCSWNINLRIPKVDLRDTSVSRVSHRMQNLHDEYLQLKFTTCKALIPAKKSQGARIIDITSTKLSGHFMGDLEQLGCLEEETAFLYAGSKGLKQSVRILLEFDGTNKSLKTSSSAVLSAVDDMSKSFSADFMRTRPKKEGPFSQTHQSFTQSSADGQDENIIRPGSRDEMDKFADDCLQQSNVTLKVELPLLRCLIPNHHFLELLYNRLVNDFALWQPSAPAFKLETPELNINIEECFKEMKATSMRLQLDSDEEEDSSDFSRPEQQRITLKEQSHLFSLLFEVADGSLLMGTEFSPAPESKQPATSAQIITDLKGTQLFVCYGYHGDLNQTFFHMTTKNVIIAQRNAKPGVGCTIPKNVMSRDFGSYHKSEVHLRSLPMASHIRERRTDDSLGVAVHLVTSENGRIKDTTVAIALRLLELNLVPVKHLQEWWIMQLKELFCLSDFDIPGYQMPITNTYLHIHLDNAVLAHDHSRIVKGSPLKYKFVLGNVDINSTFVHAMQVNKFLFLFERVNLHMAKNGHEDGGVSYEDEQPREKRPPTNMVHILEIGFFQLELLSSNEQLDEGMKRSSPLLEMKCQNDKIKAWVCHDSLVTLVNTIVEVSQSELWKDEAKTKDASILLTSTEEETRSVSSAVTKSTMTLKREGLAPSAARRMQRLVEKACEEAPVPEKPVSRKIKEPVFEALSADEAVNEWRDPDDIYFDHNLMNDAMQDLSIGSAAHNRSSSFSTDDEFFMVEDIPGCGITSSNGEPRIRLIEQNDSLESGEYFYNFEPVHFEPSNEIRMDRIPLPANYPMPLIRYNIKDISILLHIYGGNDLGCAPDVGKTYSSEEHRTGRGKGQAVPREARGGPYRDHSVSVVLDLSKISYYHQLFEKEAPVRAMNFASIQDITVHDKLTLSNIKEMLYQYATTELPRRTCSPMIAIRMMENHQQEGKLRVSMLPVRLNIDQDTLEFLEDFTQAVSNALTLPEAAKMQMMSAPMIEVPEGSSSSEPSPVPQCIPSPLPPTIPLEPTRTPTTIWHADHLAPGCDLSQLGDLDDLYGAKSPSVLDELSSLSPLPPPPVPPPRASKRRARAEEIEDGRLTIDDGLEDFMPKGLSGMDTRLLDVAGRGKTPPSEDEEEFALPARRSLFDMDDQQARQALDEIHTPAGDWASSSSIHFSSESRMDDLLARSTMEGSVYGGGLGHDLRVNSVLDEMPILDTPLLNTESTHFVSSPKPDKEDDRETICSEAPRRMSAADDDEKMEGVQIFFKDFVFSPECTIYIDYQGKNKYNIDRSGAVLGVLRGIGTLNRTEIHLKSFEHNSGLLGLCRCANHAATEWQEDIMANLPGIIGTVGAISPLVQIGKGICDLFWMPVSELRKDDGHVVKGLQKGTTSFGFTTAAAIVDLAQRFVGVVQVTAESVLFEMTPAHPALNNRNRRPANHQAQPPQDLRHGMQLAYDLIAHGVQQTKEDLELATQEDRASGRSSYGAIARYTTPVFLRPFVITTQITHHLLEGLKNQLRPDEFKDEQHKWRNDRAQ